MSKETYICTYVVVHMYVSFADLCRGSYIHMYVSLHMYVSFATYVCLFCYICRGSHYTCVLRDLTYMKETYM